MSATHDLFGPEAVNSRPTKSGRVSTVLDLRVVTGDRPLFFAWNTSQAHQPGGVFTTNIDSFMAESMPHFSHTVDTLIFSMNSSNTFD
ncbi:hypothetical protein [Corynebacterium pseudodiphtheriticum]|uniref:hypothetical protein n=1 Tax=Corynebacterium pseudodiphtheriticum TaxID=37637 RepID=UPI00254CF371|nr:hypothetical protein [Corynebacterium pseudodiphtheriticum]MDK8551182.1 hypothetical protein [Corynebacterium pseudodiphtheriticum]MDK8563085.1 hypothetical protein [Corynebacterium pseudodiphtheriticum]